MNNPHRRKAFGKLSIPFQHFSTYRVAYEDIQRASIRLFLDFEGSFLTGGFHTSGTKFGGKDTMILSGIDIQLITH
jgi:hypothetical protein